MLTARRWRSACGEALAARRVLQPVSRPMPRRLRPFMAPPEIDFRTARRGAVTEVEVECTDRPGLLSQLAAAMRRQRCAHSRRHDCNLW